MSIKLESELLASRTGFRRQACEKWMRHAGLSRITDLMGRYPGATHAECMARVRDEIEAYILGFDSEQTDAGEQTLVPGVSPVNEGEKLARMADAPKQADKPQKDADHGLFSDRQKQIDLMDLL